MVQCTAYWAEPSMVGQNSAWPIMSPRLLKITHEKSRPSLKMGE